MSSLALYHADRIILWDLARDAENLMAAVQGLMFAVESGHKEETLRCHAIFENLRMKIEQNSSNFFEL